jgi:hypothetical protein
MRRRRRRNPNKDFDHWADSWDAWISNVETDPTYRRIKRSARISDRAFNRSSFVDLIALFSLKDYLNLLSGKAFQAFKNDTEVIELQNTLTGELSRLQPKTVKKIQCLWPQLKKELGLNIRPIAKKPRLKPSKKTPSLPTSIPLPMWLDAYANTGNCVLALGYLLNWSDDTMNAASMEARKMGIDTVSLAPRYHAEVIRKIKEDYDYMNKMGSDQEIRMLRAAILDFFVCVDIPIQEALRELMDGGTRVQPSDVYPIPYTDEEDEDDGDYIPPSPPPRDSIHIKPPPSLPRPKPEYPKPDNVPPFDAYPESIPMDCDCDFAIRHIIKDLHEMQRKGRITSSEYRRLWDLYNMYVTMKRNNP